MRRKQVVIDARDSAGAPILHGASGHEKALRSRLDWLRRKHDASRPSGSHMTVEMAALEAAIRCIRFARQFGYTDHGVTPQSALRGLLDAYTTGTPEEQRDARERMEAMLCALQD